MNRFAETEVAVTEDELEDVYTPPAGALVEKGFQGLTGNESRRLFRLGLRTPTSYTSKSRMPKSYKPRILVPAPEVPILSPEQTAAHEDAVQNLVRQTGASDVASLQPKINVQGNEYLPPESFSLSRPRNEKRISPELTLSPEEARAIFTELSSEEVEGINGSRRENTHIAQFLPAEKSKSNFAYSSAEGDPTSSRSIVKNVLPSRQSNPSGLRGGSSTTNKGESRRDLIRGRKIYCPSLTNAQQEGGWTFAPRDEWIRPSNEYAIQNSRAFLNSLTPNELALNAAKLEPDFRIEDFAREKEWGINFAKRFQNAFNKKLTERKEAGVNPDMIAKAETEEIRSNRIRHAEPVFAKAV